MVLALLEELRLLGFAGAVIEHPEVPCGCLMNMVDDATGTTLCRLGEEETIWAAVGVLKAWIERYGLPRELYTDWKNVYVREPNAGEWRRGEVPVTQFGRMCQALGVEI